MQAEVLQTLTFPTFKLRSYRQESHWLNAPISLISWTYVYSSNNSISVSVRMLHASCYNNPQISLAYTVKVYFLLMQSLMFWMGSSPPSHYSGMEAASVLQLHYLGAAELFWHNPTSRGGQTSHLFLATWPGNGTHRFYLHSSGEHSVMWPSLKARGAVTHVPATALHCGRGACVFTGLSHRELALIPHLLFAGQCAKYYFTSPLQQPMKGLSSSA